MTSNHESALVGGRHTLGVVRSGSTVRRPQKPWTPTVHGLLMHLKAVGFESAPEPLGFDRQGREVLTFLAGVVPRHPLPPWATQISALESIARLQRRLHGAMRSFVPPHEAKWQQPACPAGVLGHNDFCPGNIVFRDGIAVAVIDFDYAGPTPKYWDLASAIRHWVPIKDPLDRDPALIGANAVERFHVYCTSYGLPINEWEDLLSLLEVLIDEAYENSRLQYKTGDDGSGDPWRRGVDGMLKRSAEWLRQNRHELLDAA